jgi:hypothetical protein
MTRIRNACRQSKPRPLASVRPRASCIGAFAVTWVVPLAKRRSPPSSFGPRPHERCGLYNSQTSAGASEKRGSGAPDARFVLPVARGTRADILASTGPAVRRGACRRASTSVKASARNLASGWSTVWSRGLPADAEGQSIEFLTALPGQRGAKARVPATAPLPRGPCPRRVCTDSCVSRSWQYA